MNLRGHSLAQDLKSFTGDLIFHLPELPRGAHVLMTPGCLPSCLGVQTPDLRPLVKPLHFWKLRLPVTALETSGSLPVGEMHVVGAQRI